MKKLSTSRKSGTKLFFIDGVGSTNTEWYRVYAQNKGYKNYAQMCISRGYIKLKSNDEFRIKEEFTDGPAGIVEIPSAPGYYAMQDSTILFINKLRLNGKNSVYYDRSNLSCKPGLIRITLTIYKSYRR